MNLPLHISSESKYCWIQIPKCASSTIRRVLQKYTKKDNADEYEWKHQIYTEHHKKLFNFAFVRNPFERIVSCYCEKIVNHAKWSSKKNQGEFIHYMINNNYSFSQFVKKITTDFDGKDGHWKSCSDFIPNDFSEYGFIGKCDNFKSDFSEVCNYLKIPNKEPPVFNKSKHNHYSEYYDDETFNMVENRYKDDIRRFKFKFETT